MGRVLLLVILCGVSGVGGTCAADKYESTGVACNDGNSEDLDGCSSDYVVECGWVCEPGGGGCVPGCPDAAHGESAADACLMRGKPLRMTLEQPNAFAGAVETVSGVVVFVPGTMQTIFTLDMQTHEIVAEQDPPVWSGSDAPQFSGGFQYEDHIYFMPMRSNKVGRVDLTQSPLVLGAWGEIVDPAWQNPPPPPVFDRYVTHVLKMLDDYSTPQPCWYLVPYDSFVISLFAWNGAGMYVSNLWLPGYDLTGRAKFRGGVLFNDNIYMLPFAHHSVGVLNVAVFLEESYSEVSQAALGDHRYAGGLLAGSGNIFFAPYVSDKVAICNAVDSGEACAEATVPGMPSAAFPSMRGRGSGATAGCI